MMISRSNYEIYFVDYFDGHLGAKEKAELFAFLEINGDLKEEFEQFEKITANADEKITFINKDILKKESPTLLNYKTWLIAELENDLNKEQLNTLNVFSKKHPEIEAERKALRSLKLIPEEIVYPGKKSLKKGPVIIPIRRSTIISISAVAAVVIFILGYLFINQSNKNDKIITDNKKEIPVKETPNNIAEAPLKDSLAPENHKEVATTPPSNTVAQKENNKKIILPQQKTEQLFTHEEKRKEDTTSIPELISPQPVAQPVAINQSIQHKEEPSNRESLAMSDIFDEGDLKELEKNSERHNKESNSLSSIAFQELKSFSEKSGVVIEKKNDPGSVTYAFSVGRVFSVSHSKARE